MTKLRAAPGVADVRYDHQWLDRVLSTIAVVRTLGLVLSAFLVAAVYDQHSGGMFDPAVVDPAADRLAELAGGGAALEFAIGTGRIALPLAERGVRVSGMDNSEAMLARLRAKPGAEGIEAFPGRVLNVHPALLPAFPGMHAAEQALAHGAKVAGCTVHLVDSGCDTGPLVAQAALAVREGEDAAALQARIQTLERRLFPAVLQAFGEGRIRVVGRRVEVAGGDPADEAIASMPF